MQNKYIFLGIVSLMIGNGIYGGPVGRLVHIEAPDTLDVIIKSTDESGRITKKNNPNDHPNIKNVPYTLSELENFTFTIPYKGWKGLNGEDGHIAIQVLDKKNKNILYQAKLWDENKTIYLEQEKNNSSNLSKNNSSFSKEGNFCVSACSTCICDKWTQQEVDVDVTLKIEEDGAIFFSATRGTWSVGYIDGFDKCWDGCKKFS